MILYARPDVYRVLECKYDTCCGHPMVWVEYFDEPVWSYHICAFCGWTTVCSLMPPEEVRAQFCRERFGDHKEAIEDFEARLNGSL